LKTQEPPEAISSTVISTATEIHSSLSHVASCHIASSCHLDRRRRIPSSASLRQSGGIPRMCALPVKIRGVLTISPICPSTQLNAYTLKNWLD